MSRLFLPVLLGVVLGLAAAARGFLRANREAPGAPGFVRLLAGLCAASPVTKLFYAAVLALVASQPGAEGVPRFAPADVFFVAGNAMGLVALAQGLVAAARMPRMLATRPGESAAESGRGLLGPAGRPGAIPATLMIQSFFETPAILALIGGIVALGLRIG